MNSCSICIEHDLTCMQLITDLTLGLAITNMLVNSIDIMNIYIFMNHRTI